MRLFRVGPAHCSQPIVHPGDRIYFSILKSMQVFEYFSNEDLVKPAKLFDNNETLMDLHFTESKNNDNLKVTSSEESERTKTELLNDCLEAFGNLCALNSEWIKLSIKRTKRVYALKDLIWHTERAADRCKIDLDSFKNELAALASKEIVTCTSPEYISRRLLEIENCISHTYEMISRQREEWTKHTDVTIPEIIPVYSGTRNGRDFLLERLKFQKKEAECLKMLINETEEQLSECDELERGFQWFNRELLKHRQWLRLVELEIEFINKPILNFTFDDENSNQIPAAKMKHVPLSIYKASNLIKFKEDEVAEQQEFCSCITEEEKEVCLETDHGNNQRFNYLLLMAILIFMVSHLST